MPYYSYIFFDTNDSIYRLSPEALQAAKDDFAACLRNAHDVRAEAYGMMAFRSNMRFMISLNGPSAERLQEVVRDLMHTTLAPHIRIAYTLFGITRASQYHSKASPKESMFGSPHKYLVVYPFTKTVEWHLLPFEERRSIMKAHVDVGRKYSETISQMLLYSFGIDDHEFIVSYQMDSLEDFQTLVMDMRTTESRRYTHNDLPIFTCIHMPLGEALEMI